jgi:hypothetical protein
MTVSGLAFKMRLELNHYARLHGVPTDNPAELPLAPASERPIIIRGIADGSDRGLRAERYELASERMPQVMKPQPADPGCLADSYPIHGDPVARGTSGREHPFGIRARTYAGQQLPRRRGQRRDVIHGRA